MSGSKSRNARASRQSKASRKSAPSGKPATADTTKRSTLQDRANQRKRGPKFRASGGDEKVERRVPVPTQHNDHDQRKHTIHRAGALKRLGINQEQANRLQRISHILDHAEGGTPTVIAALRLCDDPDAGKFLDKFDSVSKTDKNYLSIEEICVAAGVVPKRLLELAVSALVEDGQSAGSIVAATFHPRIIRKTAEEALADHVYYDSMGNPIVKSGYRDRHLFLQGTGFLPQAKAGGGGVFNVNIVNRNAQANVGVPDTGDGAPEQSGDRFNAAEDDLIKLHTTLDGDRLLEAPKVVESPSSVALGHMYKDMSTAVEQEELECIPTKR